MFANVNIPAPSNGAAGAPSGKDVEIVVFNWSDISNKLTRDGGKVKIVGNFTFKPGKYATTIYATSSSISLPRTAEGDEDAVGFNALPEFSHPGSSLQIEEFIANNTNKPLGIAVRTGECDGVEPFYRIYGSRCNPLSLIAEGQDDNEATKQMMKFQQFKKASVVPGRYYGTFTFDTVNTVSADTTSIDLSAGEGEYQLTDNTGATVITEMTDAVHHGKYTLIGSGGSNPATIESSNANFILAEETDWSGTAGARITFAAYEQGSDFIFIEQSRS